MDDEGTNSSLSCVEVVWFVGLFLRIVYRDGFKDLSGGDPQSPLSIVLEVIQGRTAMFFCTK